MDCWPGLWMARACLSRASDRVDRDIMSAVGGMILAALSNAMASAFVLICCLDDQVAVASDLSFAGLMLFLMVPRLVMFRDVYYMVWSVWGR